MRNKYAKVSDPTTFFTDPGNPIHEEFSPKVMPDGTIKLIKSGETNTDEYIESFRDTTDMSFILSRLALGDTSVLNPKIPFYGDFTQAPKNYAEALQLMIDGEKQFMQLPLDVRNSFDNDFRQWFAQAGNKEWFEKMDSVIIKDDTVVKEEEASS